MLETLADRRPPSRIVDDHEAPRLAQTYRGRKTSDVDQTIDRARWQHLALEPPDVATPLQEGIEPLPEFRVEVRTPVTPFELHSHGSDPSTDRRSTRSREAPSRR